MNVHTRVHIGISGCTELQTTEYKLYPSKGKALQTLLGCLRKCPDF